MSALDVTGEWAEVATVMHTAPPVAAPQPAAAASAGRRTANLALVMRSPLSRRDLRRLLMVVGAIGRPRPADAPPQAGTVRTADVVAALMNADAEMLRRVLHGAGTIADPQRLQRFADGIARANGMHRCEDAESVSSWVAQVARVLRDDGTG